MDVRSVNAGVEAVDGWDAVGRRMAVGAGSRDELAEATPAVFHVKQSERVPRRHSEK